MATIQLAQRDLARMRRLALNAQGLNRAAPFGRGLPGTRRAIEHLGYVQIDTISVVERAHHHVLHNRVPNFQPAMLDRLLHQRAIFEYWAHAAAFLPMRDYRFSLPYKNAIRTGKRHWFRNRDQRLMDDLLQRIRQDGALRSRDVEDARGKGAGWWDWKPAKRALEQLYIQGDLMVSERQGFQKTYDLPERVLPDGVDTREPSTEEYADFLIEQQLDCHGAASLKGITYQRRDEDLRRAVKQSVTAREQAGDLDRLIAPNGQSFFARPGAMETPAPRVGARLHILSPFDNTIIQRDRLTSLFQFDYQIECYVPEDKRVYGYFCLPLLYRDTFVGRMDCKAHRRESRLELKAVHFCPHPYTDEEVLDALSAAVTGFAEFQNCSAVMVTSVEPQRLRAPLSRLVQATLN